MQNSSSSLSKLSSLLNIKRQLESEICWSLIIEANNRSSNLPCGCEQPNKMKFSAYNEKFLNVSKSSWMCRMVLLFPVLLKVELYMTKANIKRLVKALTCWISREATSLSSGSVKSSRIDQSASGIF
ncbi:hypothetical protein WICPIJ_007272 [Wickerhamomyces pijperi]|uniref:Uncharacterized protein n=1 Tax=Wickerhamomyces pijperi TaxID=599730 RepID=A0A9P8TK37_WICPI|nr:hypothetical protein WICPIJ_007272 [Wickerhamomyces pijperi]